MKNLTVKEKDQMYINIFKEIQNITEKKSHDYAGTEDCISNLRDFGWQGILVRLGDKYHRLKNFVKSDTIKVSDENIEDTMIDLINYGFILLIMYELEKNNGEKNND
ncbi:MAG TPA: DUF1599 domain-containing protein [Candidatus Pacearchaeota archaeon]|nr:DUF1599 domain-containing protein [Candidatus Pacearchaeota archaeon]